MCGAAIPVYYFELPCSDAAHVQYQHSTPRIDVIAPGGHLGPNRLFTTEVIRFYENLADVFDRYGFEPNRIFSANESGSSYVQKTPPVISNNGQKWARVARRFERSRNITVHCAMSTSRLFVSSMLIFLCK
jgi:hypothetical protein